MKLEIGKRYVRRDGKITGNIIKDPSKFGLIDPVHEVNYFSDGTFLIFKENYRDLIKEYKEENKTKTMRTLKPKDAKRIIDIACFDWKDKLAKKWGANITLNKNIEVSDKEYRKMRDACTAPQNKLFDEIFGIDEEKLEVGKWYEADGRLFLFNGEYNEDGAPCGVGFIHDNWNDYECVGWNGDLTPASKETVEKALIAEAKKRGFNKGVHINSIWLEHGGDSQHPLNGGLFLKKCSELWGCSYLGTYTIFKDGKWATIAEQSKEDKNENIKATVASMEKQLEELKKQIG